MVKGAIVKNDNGARTIRREVNRLTALVNASSKENVTLTEQIKTFQRENSELNTKLTSLTNK